MYRKLDRMIEVYKQRREGCLDMVTYFSDHLNLEMKETACKCGIDENDLEYCPEMIDILGIDPNDLLKK